MFKNVNTPKDVIGHSLIELIIALLLGSVLLLIVINIYINCVQSFRWQQQLRRIQFIATDVNDYLRAVKPQVGVAGCQAITNSLSYFGRPDWSLSQETQLAGTDHQLTLRYMQMPYQTLFKQMDPHHLVVDKQYKVKNHQAYLIADCEHAEIFEPIKTITRAHDLLVLIDRPLQFTYRNNARVGRLIKETIFLAKTNRHDLEGKPISALFRKRGVNTLEIADHLSDINFKYSLVNSSKLFRAKFIQHWEFVTGVELEYTVLIGKLKKVFTMYVALLP